MEAHRGGCVFCPEQLLVDCEGPFVELPGFFALAQLVKEYAQLIQALRHLAAFRTQGTLPNGQRPFQGLPGIGVVRQDPHQATGPMQTGRYLGMVRAQQLLPNLQNFPSQGQRLQVIALGVEGLDLLRQLSRPRQFRPLFLGQFPVSGRRRRHRVIARGTRRPLAHHGRAAPPPSEGRRRVENEKHHAQRHDPQLHLSPPHVTPCPIKHQQHAPRATARQGAHADGIRIT